MIKCKCLYDKKSLSMYGIAFGITLGLLLLMIYQPKIEFTWPSINLNWMGVTVPIFGVGLLTALLIGIPVWFIRDFCSQREPRNHATLLGAIIPLSILVLSLYAISDPLQGGYMNFQIVESGDMQATLNNLTCDDIRKLDVWTNAYFVFPLDRPEIRVVDEHEKNGSRITYLTVPSQCVQFLKYSGDK